MPSLKINSDPISVRNSTEGLIGIAIILILLYHCFPALYKIGTGIGWVGIDLIFVIAGFRIFGYLLDSKGHEGFYKHYYQEGAARVLPLLFLFNFVFFMVLAFVTKAQWLADYQYYYENQGWYWLMASNILVSINNNWPPVIKPIIDHFWAIHVLFQFWLISPFLVRYLNHKQLLITGIFLIVQSIVLRNIFVNIDLSYAVSYVFTLGRFDALFTGAVVAILIRNEKSKKVLEQSTPIILFSVLVLIAGLIFFSKSLSLKNDYFIRIGYTLFAVLFAAVIVYAISENPIMAKLTRNRLLSWFAKYSLGIYVFHWFFITLFSTAIESWLGFIPVAIVKNLLTSGIAVGLILILAWLSWHIYERPFIRKSKSIE